MTATLTLVDVPIKKLIEHAVNVRNGSSQGFDDKSLDELANSILANGLLQPLKVHGNDDGKGVYQVIAGHRRLRAMQLLVERKDWKANVTVPCVVGDNADDGDATVQMLVENLQRVDISPMDEARGYRSLVDEHGYTQRELAEKVGKASGHITKRLALLTIDARFEAFIDKGTVTLEQAYEVSQLDDKQQKALLKKLLDQPSMAASSFEYAVNAATQTKKAKAAKATFDKALEKAMIETVDKLPEPRSDWIQIGSYDKSSLDDYKPAKSHVVVKSTNSWDPNRITVYRKKTKADIAKAQKQQEAADKAWAERAAERVEHMDPHQRWAHAEHEKTQTYREQLHAFGEQVDAALGNYILELAPKDAGKLAMAIVASLGFDQPRTSATRLGVSPITTNEDGSERDSWQFDYEGPLREWVGNDTAKLVKCWLAGAVKVSKVMDLGEFEPFRVLLTEAGVVTPERPVPEPEPWLNTETGEWSTEPHPEGEDQADDDYDEIEEIEIEVDTQYED